MVRDLMQTDTLTPRKCGLANCPSSASLCSDWPSRLHPCLTSTKCHAIAFQIQSHSICYTLDSPQQTDHVKIQQGSVRASNANMHTNRSRLDLPHYSYVCFFLELYSQSQRGSWWDPNKYRARECNLADYPLTVSLCSSWTCHQTLFLTCANCLADTFQVQSQISPRWGACLVWKSVDDDCL